MGATIYISNQIEALSLKFIEKYKADQDVFYKEPIVTQTDGMGQWLVTETAKATGAMANYSLLRLEQFFRQISELAHINTYNFAGTQEIVWFLYSLLNKLEFIKQFPEVSNYYKGNDIKRFQLAQQIADLFDQYMVYRPKLIKSWNLGEPYTDKDYGVNDDFDKHQKWQIYLWIELKENPQKKADVKSLFHEQLLFKLDDAGIITSLKQHYKRVSIFGLSIITDYHASLLNKLSEHIEVNLYLTNPSPHSEWLKEKPGKEKGNQILQTYGKLYNETFQILSKYENLRKGFNFELFREPTKDNLLDKIKNDIYTGKTEQIEKVDPSKLQSDFSVRIASSYTAAREVEALYDYLLYVFAHNKGIEPKDVVVLMNNAEIYTPYIKAVFDNVAEQLPYSIIEKEITSNDNLVNNVLDILKLDEEDVTSETVLKILESKAVREKFQISDMDQVRTLVQSAGIRFGIEGRGKDQTNLISWYNGLKKMVLSYAMYSDEPYQDVVGDDDDSDDKNDLFYLLNEIEGDNALTALKIKCFADTLFKTLDERGANRKMALWCDYVRVFIVDRMLHIKDEEDELLQYLYSTLDALAYAGNSVDEELSFEVFRESFTMHLKLNKKITDCITGKIAFSSMIPMRSIPAKVIALLGLNLGELPRKESPLGFDLMQFKKLIGDRDIKSNDRHLFLESILAAKEHLYLSYIGSSIKDNSQIPPSLLVEQFTDYLETGIKKEQIKKDLSMCHPLHGFSQKYVDKESNLFRYEKQFKVLDVEDAQQEKKDPVDLTIVTIDNLIWFFKHPVKCYFNKTLQIFYEEDEKLLPEEELFDLNHLEKHIVKSDLLYGVNKTDYIKKGQHHATLPLAYMAEGFINKAETDIKNLKKHFEALTQGHEEFTMPIEINLGEITLKGNLNKLFGENQILFNVSKADKQHKYWIETWIKHLCIYASGKTINTYYMGMEDSEPKHISYPLTKEMAIKNLIALLEIYVKGHKEIQMYFSEQFQKAIDRKTGKFDIEKYLKYLKEFGTKGEYPDRPYDIYLNKLFDEKYPDDKKQVIFDDVMKISQLFSVKN